jgi:hypothetical protein
MLKFEFPKQFHTKHDKFKFFNLCIKSQSCLLVKTLVCIHEIQ